MTVSGNKPCRAPQDSDQLRLVGRHAFYSHEMLPVCPLLAGALKI